MTESVIQRMSSRGGMDRFWLDGVNDSKRDQPADTRDALEEKFHHDFDDDGDVDFLPRRRVSSLQSPRPRNIDQFFANYNRALAAGELDGMNEADVTSSHTQSGDIDRSIRYAAIGLLARREHSREELKRKLVQKFDDQRVRAQVEALAAEGLQSDERFVEAFIRTKKAQGKGPAFIKQDLRRRGVSEFLIAAYIYDNDEDWLTLAHEVYHKKFGSASVEDAKDKARRIRFMVSRGFSPELVFRMLDGKFEQPF